MSRQLATLAIVPTAVLMLCAPSNVTAQTKAADTPSKTAPSRVVDLKGTDGVALKATYFPAPRPGPALLLFHACNRDRSSWTAFATAAAARGFHALALDFRGFGESGGPRFEIGQQQQGIIEEKWPGDVDAAFAWLTSQAGVDKTRVAAAGASCGVNQSVLLARRHPEVKTVVLLSGAVNPAGREYLRDSAWLPIFAAASHRDGGAVGTMRWAMGWSRNPSNKFVEYKAAGHGTDMFAVEKGLQPQMLTWLETHLRNAPTATPAKATASKPTAAEEFWTTLNQPGGVERARKLYEEAKKRDKNVVLFPEGETNLLGYQLLNAGNFKDAIAVFQLNVEGYPQSANVYDSLSDGYVALGNRDEALKNAQKAVEMIDKDLEANPDFKRVVRESAEKKIKELQAARK
jgi:pimeloyl-ACP methyl ester carboxylesterase